jgi:hypothetical protein
MRALLTGGLYFGTFLIVGLIARRWVARRNVDLSEIRAELGPSRSARWRHLLGFWHRQDPDL